MLFSARTARVPQVRHFVRWHAAWRGATNARHRRFFYYCRRYKRDAEQRVRSAPYLRSDANHIACLRGVLASTYHGHLPGAVTLYALAHHFLPLSIFGLRLTRASLPLTCLISPLWRARAENLTRIRNSGATSMVAWRDASC